MEDILVKRSHGERIIESIGTAPLAFPNHLQRPGYSAWSKKPNESLTKPLKHHHPIIANTPAQLYPQRRLCARSKWGTRTWNTWAAMEYQEHLPTKYLANLNADPQWWTPPIRNLRGGVLKAE